MNAVRKARPPRRRRSDAVAAFRRNEAMMETAGYLLRGRPFRGLSGRALARSVDAAFEALDREAAAGRPAERRLCDLVAEQRVRGLAPHAGPVRLSLELTRANAARVEGRPYDLPATRARYEAFRREVAEAGRGANWRPAVTHWSG